MKVFVTGATGGLGRNVCLKLVGLGWNCIASGRDLEVGHWLKDHEVQFIAANLADVDGMARAMAGCDAVLHCAALSSPWGTREQFYRHNVMGTANVLRAAGDAGIRRIVFVSTPSVYFDFTHRRNISEDAPLPVRSVNAYASSKLAAEGLVMDAVRQGMDCVILRPRGIIGPWDKALAPRLAKLAKRGWIPLPGGGHALIDVTCAANVADALVSATLAGPHVSGSIYNISNGVPLTARDLIAKALAVMGLSAKCLTIPVTSALWASRLLEIAARMTGGWEPPVTAYALGLLAFDQTLDTNRARTELGWEPLQSLDEGLEIFGKWWKSNYDQG